MDSYQSIHTNNCTHRFHTNCINKWHEKKKPKICPLCRGLQILVFVVSDLRQPLSVMQYYQVYLFILVSKL